jgi:hypothetical protein
MSLDQSGNDMASAGLFGAGGGEHSVGLADAWRGTEKYLQVPSPFLFGASKQCVRRSSLRFHFRHSAPR